MKKTKLYLLLLIIILSNYSCKRISCDKSSMIKPYIYDDVTPTPFPKNLRIKNFKFPQDSTTILNWIHNYESSKRNIYLHGWGIWVGLTNYSNQFVKGQSKPLRIYETWLTPNEMIEEIKNGELDYKNSFRSNRTNLRKPRQFVHAENNGNKVNDKISESVSYSPTAAEFAIKNKIFMATTLYDYAKHQKLKEVPEFPNDGITIKPVFMILKTSSGNTSFKIAAWNGTINEPKNFPPKKWNSSVTIDVTNLSVKNDTLFHLNDFIHYKLNQEDIDFYNKEFNLVKNGANEGDIAILVAMHVSTKEIKNWTWQTFWWDKKADNPPLPSSKEIADMRPKALVGAARNYAMAVNYYMVDPNEPYDLEPRKKVEGKPYYAFNPYLEAGFGCNVFNIALSHVNTKNNKTIGTYAGVRTNCMSCHRMATVNPDSLHTKNTSQTPYVGNSFVARNDTIFKNQLLLDFAWSIQGNIDTTGLANYLKSHKH